jgi:hypothetical protein
LINQEEVNRKKGRKKSLQQQKNKKKKMTTNHNSFPPFSTNHCNEREVVSFLLFCFVLFCFVRSDTNKDALQCEVETIKKEKETILVHQIKIFEGWNIICWSSTVRFLQS